MTRRKVGLESPKSIDWQQVEAYARQTPLRLEPSNWQLVTHEQGAELHLHTTVTSSFMRRQALLEAGAALGYFASLLHLQGYAPQITLLPQRHQHALVAQIDVAAAPQNRDTTELLAELTARFEATAAANPVWMRVLDHDHEPRRFARHKDHLIVLYTDADTDMDWLASGLATARIILSGEVEGVAIAVLESAFRNPNLRLELHQMIGRTNYPQVVLQLGQLISSSTPQKAHKQENKASIQWIERAFSGVHHEKV